MWQLFWCTLCSQVFQACLGFSVVNMNTFVIMIMCSINSTVCFNLVSSLPLQDNESPAHAN